MEASKSPAPTHPHSTSRPQWTQQHWALRAETKFNLGLVRLFQRLGWQERVEPYVGYGLANEWVRVLGRVVVSPKKRVAITRSSIQGAGDQPRSVRGWRSFSTVQAPRAVVTVTFGDQAFTVQADHDGYVDAVLPIQLMTGWHEVTLQTANGATSTAGVQVIGPEQRLGLVSDIDDTAMVTAVPRFFLAVWNSLVVHESARKPVPGMAQLYNRLRTQYSDMPMFYLSTGAWNVVPAMLRFFAHNQFPAGSLLMTDFGPTNTGWFRSGKEHKERSLHRLASDFPNIQWILIGDDGQRDPLIYNEFAASAPDHVAGIAIRQLSPTQAVLAHGTVGDYPAGRTHNQEAPNRLLTNRSNAEQTSEEEAGFPKFSVRGKDGFVIANKLEARGILLSRGA